MLLYRVTLDELLADDVMEPVLGTARYKPDEFGDDDGDGPEARYALIGAAAMASRPEPMTHNGRTAPVVLILAVAAGTEKPSQKLSTTQSEKGS
jgi:hypothetical protein